MHVAQASSPGQTVHNGCMFIRMLTCTVSFLSTTCLLVNLLEGDALFIIPVSVVAAKIYAIAVLAVLNARQTIAQKADGPLDTEWLGLSSLRFTNPHTVEDRAEVDVHGVVDNPLHSAQLGSKSMIQPIVTECLPECVQV
ncbi:hypothetical protein C8Q74DRAFT_1274376 [Fomes fomentarius]|nr:hypothetical protein C8Q74DRAFT_1274376 [Fomes fomentarius]